jgi:multiple sugar transport system ATP-binding protein
MANIKLENIVKRYGDVIAVRDFSLEIQDKEFVVFLGPSGCGKTTTLRLIAGLEHPEEGNIFIDGERVNDLSPADRDIAFVFQFYGEVCVSSFYGRRGFAAYSTHSIPI